MPWYRRGDGVLWHVDGALAERLRREGYEEVDDPTAPSRHEEVQGAPAHDGDAHQPGAADGGGPGRRKPGV